MKTRYEYNVGGIATSSREAARVIQRSFREIAASGKPINGVHITEVPKIVQRVITERVVR